MSLVGKGFRQINVNGIPFHFKVGNGYVKIVQRENYKTKRSTWISFSELTGMEWHVIDHDQGKRNFAITPGVLAAWINHVWIKNEKWPEKPDWDVLLKNTQIRYVGQSRE